MAKGKSSSAAVDKISLVINERTADWTLGAMVQISAAAALSCGFGRKNCGEEDSGSGVADMPVVTMAMMLFSLYNVLRWG